MYEIIESYLQTEEFLTALVEPLAAANHPPPVSKVPSLPSGRAACRGREMSVHIIQIHAYVHAHDHEDLKPKTLCSEWCNVCR